jgi:hypothetical protein
LLGAFLDFWDGRVPKRKNVSNGVPSNQDVFQKGESDELSIILKNNNAGWEVGWRLPAIVTGQSYAIKVGDNEEIQAKLELVGTHIHCVSSTRQSNARSALNQSALKKTESILSYIGSSGGRN